MLLLLLSKPALALNPDSIIVYRNIVFEGGGVRGIAYTGALAVLYQQHKLDSLERVGGTSVGAITALLVALNYTPDEMRTVLDDLKIQQFNDGQWFFIGGFSRMARRYGWYRGQRFERWLEGLISPKTGNSYLTFAELHQRRSQRFHDLYVTGTNLTTQRAVVFSHEQTPDMPLKTAVRISMSIRLYFGAVFLDQNNQVVARPRRGQAYQILVDGGITANYPLDLFDTPGHPNPETLGLKLERPAQLAQLQTTGNGVATYPIHSLPDYVSAFYNYVIENLNQRGPLADEQRRTIYISMEGIKPRVRRMNVADRTTLIESGKRAATQFLTR